MRMGDDTLKMIRISKENETAQHGHNQEIMKVEPSYKIESSP